MPPRFCYRRFPFVSLALALICSMPVQCSAWGPSAHRIIASIAVRNLKPKARLSVNELLSEKDFIAASTWADEVRALRPETSSWHFVNMPQYASAFVASRDCPDGQCAVAVIQRFESVLLSKNSKFVGDRTLLSSSRDGTVRVWRGADDNSVLAQLRGRTSRP
jgi:hypothetical protein